MGGCPEAPRPHAARTRAALGGLAGGRRSRNARRAGVATRHEDFLASVVTPSSASSRATSSRWSSRSASSWSAPRPLDVYRVLRALNPSPYMYLLSLEKPGGEPYQIVGLLARGAGEGAGGTRVHASHRRFAPARRHPGGGPRPGGLAARRRQGARRAPHARRPGPERPAQGVRGRFRRGDGVHADRAVQPHHAHRVVRRGRPSAAGDARSTSSGRPSRPARSRGRRSRWLCASSTSWSPRSAACTAA